MIVSHGVREDRWYRAVPVAAVRAELGESPLWDPAAGLRWLDVPGRRLHTLGRDGGETAVPLPATVTAVELGEGPELLAVTETGFGWLDPATGALTVIATAVDEPGLSMNDGGIDPRGRCWAGSAVRDGSRRGALYRLSAGTVTSHAGGLGMSNGIDWSVAGDVLYHVDSTAGTVTAWEYHPETGELGGCRVLRRVPAEVGLPDGLTVDAAGQLWLAVWGAGQVWRLDPDTGDTTAVIEPGTPYPTSCTFGGSELSTLYITTGNYQRPAGGGLLYAAALPVPGRAPRRYAGGDR